VPSDRRAALLIVAAAVLWGTTGTAQALGPDGLDPLAVGSARLLVGGAGLVALSLARGRRPWTQRWPLPLTALTAAAIAGYQLTFFGAVRLTGVAAGTIVAIGSGPVFGGLLDRIVRRQPLTGRWVASTSLAVAGAALLISAGDVRLDPAGVALALTAGFSYAVYALTIKLLSVDRNPDDVVVIGFAAGGLALLPLLVVVGGGTLATPGGLAVVLHLGLITVTLSYILFGRGLTGVNVGTATTLSLAEPVTAALLGVALVGERLDPPQWVGVAVVLAGLALLTAPSRRRPPPRPPAAAAVEGAVPDGPRFGERSRLSGRSSPHRRRAWRR
jgi:drug/metabolite transporter, DME family